MDQGSISNPSDRVSAPTNLSWFEYPVRVYPHHTDYAGVVWHGSYIAWMEEARTEHLGQIGLQYADLVEMGCELPVVGLSIRYHRSLRFGMTAVVKIRLCQMKGVRMEFDHRIESVDGQELYVTAQVTLVAIDNKKGKIMRQFPDALKDILPKLAGY